MTRVTISDKKETLEAKNPGGLSRKPSRLKASYDAAQTTPSNTKHWQAADHYSAAASNSESVRDVLRKRSRYEIANNGYAKGAIKNIVDDLIGRGPRPQIRSGDKITETDRQVEAAFNEFLKSISLTQKLRTLKKGELASGEAFGVFSRGLRRRAGRRGAFDSRGQVELGFHILEADQVQTPDLYEEIGGEVSGIEQDQYGNPIAYHVLKNHPGDNGISTVLFNEEYTRVPADMVAHYFEPERPGDARGVPPFTCVLEQFAYLRRLILATLDSSENIANIAGMLKTDGPADSESSSEVDTLDTIDFERGQIMVLPDGWDYTQARAEQPTDSFPEFVKQILKSIARALNLPYSIFAGDSTELNYSSGRLDHQGYRKMIRNEQEKLLEVVLEPLFWHWFDEASRISGVLPEGARSLDYRDGLVLRFFFDGSGHVDPVKEAKGTDLQIKMGTSSLPIEAAKNGHDWRDLVDHEAQVEKYRIEKGLAPKAGDKAQGEAENQPPAIKEAQSND